MRYDLTNVAAAWRAGLYDDVRPKLFADLTKEAQASAGPVARMVQQIAQHAAEQPGCTPEMTVRIAMAYGMCLGVLLEQDRLQRENRIVS
jgi:hypothetical protein